jgi:hypothetical protein
MLVGRTSSFSFYRAVSQASYPKLKQLSNFTLGSQFWSCISRKRRNVTSYFIRSIHSQPLRILFCGADELSITSLEALHKELLESPSNVASIDVVCRPGKPSGRGLKQIRHRMLTWSRGLNILTCCSSNQGRRGEVGASRSPDQHIYWVEGEPTGSSPSF